MIDLIVGLAIVSMILISFNAWVEWIARTSLKNQNKLQAELFLREGIEIAKDLEKSNWSLLEECFYPITCGFSPNDSLKSWEKNAESKNEETLNNVLYARILSTEKITNNNIRVMATVSWSNHDQDYNLYLETYVYKGL